jgi:hypothetical protein
MDSYSANYMIGNTGCYRFDDENDGGPVVGGGVIREGVQWDGEEWHEWCWGEREGEVGLDDVDARATTKDDQRRWQRGGGL